MGSKENAYKDICKRTRGLIGEGMDDCRDCEEVNLWTYWQGRGGGLDPDILLVGQDWGCASKPEIAQTIANVKAMNGEGRSLAGTQYHDGVGLEGMFFSTDRNLCELFEALGYDIRSRRYEELFFTNLVPGYRKGNSSGGSVKRLITADVLGSFRDLVELLEPNAVLCLGRETADGVLRSFGQQPPKGRYLDAVLSGPIAAQHGSGETAVFPLYHCGYYGVLGRNKAEGMLPASGYDLDAQRRDWEHIAEWLEQHGE